MFSGAEVPSQKVVGSLEIGVEMIHGVIDLDFKAAEAEATLQRKPRPDPEQSTS